MRISAELIDVKNGTATWSQHYDRPYKDLFKLQDDITNAVAKALKAKLLGGSNAPPPQSDRPPSGNLDAYNAYLEGSFYTHRNTPENKRDDGPVQIAEIYGQRKDADNLFKWLEHARTVKDPGLRTLLYDPFLLPYRHDPRFAKLCKEMNLPVPKN